MQNDSSDEMVTLGYQMKKNSDLGMAQKSESMQCHLLTNKGLIEKCLEQTKALLIASYVYLPFIVPRNGHALPATDRMRMAIRALY